MALILAHLLLLLPLIILLILPIILQAILLPIIKLPHVVIPPIRWVITLPLHLLLLDYFDPKLLIRYVPPVLLIATLLSS